MARGQKRLSSDLELGGGGEDGGMGREELSGERGPNNPKRRLVVEILKSTTYSYFTQYTLNFPEFLSDSLWSAKDGEGAGEGRDGADSEEDCA